MRARMRAVATASHARSRHTLKYTRAASDRRPLERSSVPIGSRTLDRRHGNHFFHLQEDGTILMEDVFSYSAPLGPLGWLAERLFLTAYMTRFLKERNAVLVALAESNDWQQFLPDRKVSDE